MILSGGCVRWYFLHKLKKVFHKRYDLIMYLFDLEENEELCFYDK